MNVLFCHNGPLLKDEENNYYGVSHNDESLKRYYTISDKLSILMRVNSISKIEAESRMSKISLKSFEVIECPNINSLKGRILHNKKAREVIEEAVINSDYIVVRIPSSVGSIALHFAKIYNKPYIIEIVACKWDSLWNHSLKGKVMAVLTLQKTKKEIYHSSNVLYITEKFLQDRYPTKGESYICPNVILQPQDPKVLINRLENIENLKLKNKIVIASIGAVNMRYKGHKYMIEAISILKKKGYNIEYHIAGGGNSERLMKSAKKHGVTDRVILLGAVPHAKIFGVLDNIDIYVQPSLAEAQGRSLIEAMSRGCPSICTNTGGMPELIAPQYIAEKGNAQSLALKILDILNSDMKKIAERNYDYAKKFDKNIIEEKRNQIFKEVFTLKG